MDKNKIMMISILGLLIVLIVGVALIGVLILRMPSSDSNNQVNTAQEIDQLSQDEIQTISLSSPITTNLLTDTDGVSHDIKVGLSIGVDMTDGKNSEELILLLSTKEAVIRDIVISILRNTTYKEANRPDGQDVLEEEIKLALQKEFQTDLIVEVNFSEFYTI